MESDLLAFVFALNIKAFLLVGLGLLLVLVTKNFRTKFRQAVWRYLIGLLIVLPALVLILPPVAIQLPSLPSASVEQFITSGAKNFPTKTFNDRGWQGATEIKTNLAIGDTEQRIVVPDNTPINWIKLLFLGYNLVSVLLAIKLLLGVLDGHRRVKKMYAYPDLNLQPYLRGKRPTKLLTNPRNETPFVWGFRQPAIILPANFQSYRADTQQNILRHELIHIQNHDWLWAIVGRFCCCLYWPNPFVWAAVRISNLEAEKICDEHVLAAGEDREHYAEQLLHVAKSLQHPASATAIAPSMARPSILRRRIDNILTNRRRKDMKPVTQNLMKVAFIITSVLLVAINSQGQTSKNQPNSINPPEQTKVHTPILRVEPVYPKTAANQGVEGYVIAEFDILASGKVSNVKVVEAEPSGVFDGASVTAVQQWLYFPKQVQDKSVETKGVRTKLSYKLGEPGSTIVSISPAQLENLQQLGPQNADEALKVIKYHLKARNPKQATNTLVAYLTKVETGEADGALDLVDAVPVNELEQTVLKTYLTHLQRVAEKSETGDTYALLAGFYRAQKQWPAAQLALLNAFERGQLSEPMATKMILLSVLFNTQHYEAASQLVDNLVNEYGENETLVSWRNIVAAEGYRHRYVADQLLSQATR